MTAAGLIVRAAGAGLALQDAGRRGFQGFGVSRGGAMDVTGLAAARALVGTADGPAIEIGAGGATFEVTGGPVVVGLAGAAFRATASDQGLTWSSAHRLEPGTVLTLRPERAGGYGYLCLGGGIVAEPVLGSASVHFGAGIGTPFAPGDLIRARAPEAGRPGWTLAPEDRLDVLTVARVLPSVQDHLFPPAEKARFEATTFKTSHRANRTGMALEYEGAGFKADGHLSITSETVMPGDVQLVGDGQPYVLFGECQTTGGYPRIASVISADLTMLAQLPPGAAMSFRFVDLAVAIAARADMARRVAGIAGRMQPLLRDPYQIADLLSYQLISGAISGAEDT